MSEGAVRRAWSANWALLWTWKK